MPTWLKETQRRIKNSYCTESKTAFLLTRLCPSRLL